MEIRSRLLLGLTLISQATHKVRVDILGKKAAMHPMVLRATSLATSVTLVR